MLDRFEPAVAALARATLARVEALAPGAHRNVYDAYNALAIGFGTGPRLGDGFIHVAVYPRHVNLGFNRGVDLPDPEGLLEGSGSRIRHVTIRDAAQLSSRAIGRLVRAAAAQQGLKRGADGPLAIQKVYPRQRPRRPAARE